MNNPRKNLFFFLDRLVISVFVVFMTMRRENTKKVKTHSTWSQMNRTKNKVKIKTKIIALNIWLLLWLTLDFWIVQTYASVLIYIRFSLSLCRSLSLFSLSLSKVLSSNVYFFVPNRGIYVAGNDRAPDNLNTFQA